MPRLTIAIMVAAGACGIAFAQAPTAPGAAASPLPPGPAHDVMVRTCSGCHAPEVAAQQRLDPAAWKELVETMASRGAQASDEELAQITDYLAHAFPDKPATR